MDYLYQTARSSRLAVVALALIMLIGCNSQEQERTWFKAEFLKSSVRSDTVAFWQFDSVQYAWVRLAILESNASSATSEQTIGDFKKVISGWVADGTAEAFWQQLRRDLDVVELPLVIEMGNPRNSPAYMCRAIVHGQGKTFLVRTKPVTPVRMPELEYSVLSESEFQKIMVTLAKEYGIFNMSSDLKALADDPNMAVLEAEYAGGYTLLLFSLYNQPSDSAAKAMFEYLDSLFWGKPS